ncbi:hypothetical protein [Pseudaestuariivita rosea]|uniref:hypothetical protein n=1 Tax=Pseudaestuariivita rosea TaxID=2763263 RepID=UPI001ABAD048|nr:hypothetical protein [Pseudaestuariivita rosea]
MRTPADHTAIIASKIADIVPEMAQSKLRPLLPETVWDDIGQSPRMCRILASHIVGCLELRQISDGVLTLAQHGHPRLSRAVDYAGAALCAYYLRQLIKKSAVEAIIGDIGEQAYQFAMACDQSPTGLIGCTISTEIIRHIGQCAFAGWINTLSDAEVRLIRLTVSECDHASPLPHPAPEVFQMALEATDA